MNESHYGVMGLVCLALIVIIALVFLWWTNSLPTF